MKDYKNILVSVIIPVYNIENYIYRCVNSIINQTHSELEILLIDDGSTDGSKKVCDELAKTDNRITVLHQENQGPSEARNLGINNSHGDYISFVDGDDYINPRMIEILIKEIIDNNSDISVCGVKKVLDSNDELLEFANIEDYKIYNVKQDEIFDLYFKSDIHYDLNVVWNKIYKKVLFENIKFTKGILHEDNDISYKLMDKSRQLTIVYCDLYYYVQRIGSTMHKTIDSKRSEDIIYVNSNMIDYFSYKQKYLFESYKRAIDFILAIMKDFSFCDNESKNKLIVYGKSLIKKIRKDLTLKEIIYYNCFFNFNKLYLLYYKTFKS